MKIIQNKKRIHALFFSVLLTTGLVSCVSQPPKKGHPREKKQTSSEQIEKNKTIFANLKRLHLLSMVYYQKFNSLPNCILDLKKLKPSLIEGLNLRALDESYNMVQLVDLPKIRRPDITPFILYDSSNICWIIYIDGHVVVYQKVENTKQGLATDNESR